MKIYFDDDRTPPEGWMQVRLPEEVIKLLETGKVTEISLDHDLGDDIHGTGCEVIPRIEEAVATTAFYRQKLAFILPIHRRAKKWKRELKC